MAGWGTSSGKEPCPRDRHGHILAVISGEAIAEWLSLQDGIGISGLGICYLGLRASVPLTLAKLNELLWSCIIIITKPTLPPTAHLLILG